MAHYNILAMFEDDPAVVNMVRSVYPEINIFQAYDNES